MAKVKEVSVKVEFLKSLPNYQNIRFSAGMVVDVEDSDDVNKIYDKMWNDVAEQVYAQIKEFDDAPVKKGLI